MRVLPAILLAGLAAGVLASCRTPTASTQVESYPHNKVTVNSKILGSRLEITEVSFTNRHGRAIAQIRAQNVTQTDLMFEYRYRWLDDAGMHIKRGVDQWMPTEAAARADMLMEQMAPNKEATDFIFEVRFRAPNTRWK